MSAVFTVCDAVLSDAPAIAEIYAHHVLHGVATFEIEPPGAEEMAARMVRLRDAGSPWLVAREEGGDVLGYAYAGQLGPRAAYRFACEDSIYLRHDRLGLGIGKALLSALIDVAGASGFRQMVALIAAAPGTRPASLALHARAGFSPCGTLEAVGRKHGRWIDVHYMQRPLGEGSRTAPRQEP
ncbi:MAG: N-acetyltransferase [Novosphingobium sp.]|nr:N-acetyltransferase [Novosphingobium sp.]MCP5403513.1 N-acetyltransferase [Novosphingobium sp.]